MKRGRFTEEQIIGFCASTHAGAKTADLARKQASPKRRFTPKIAAGEHCGVCRSWARTIGRAKLCQIVDGSWDPYRIAPMHLGSVLVTE